MPPKEKPGAIGATSAVLRKQLNAFTTKKEKPAPSSAADTPGASRADFPKLRNDLLIRAARGERTERPPVWIMRQAGRYLPEFRAIRERHEYLECCRTPALAAEITLQPLLRYHDLLDAAVIFSDILVVPQAMGLRLEMIPGKGPHFPEPLLLPADADKRLRKKVDVRKELGYVLEAITLTRHKLEGRVPLIGFCGAPWTLMTYMVEGGGAKELDRAKRWIWAHRDESKALLERITDVCITFLVEQVRAGCQVLQVFDSWAGTLTPSDFRTFSLPYLRAIAAGVKDTLALESRRAIPMILYAKGAGNHSLPEMAKSGFDVLSLDWTVQPGVARNILDMSALPAARGRTAAAAMAGATRSVLQRGLSSESGATTPASQTTITPPGTTKENVNSMEATQGHRIALQGNLDPSVLFAGKEAIRDQVDKMLRAKRGGFGGSGAYIANLGQGITPGVDPEDLRYFLRCVHEVGREIYTCNGEE